MHIKICTAPIDKSNLLRNKNLHQIKAAKKGLLNNYSPKMVSSISSLQDKSSESVESNNHNHSRAMYS